MSRPNTKLAMLAAGILACAMLAPIPAFAHCDGLDGPVVNAARKALATGNVDLVLIWIQPGDEQEIRQAFAKTRSVRMLNPEARDLADRHFFETLVRLHRAGEGAPYRGLQPAGRDLGPAIPAADKAIETGSVDQLSKMIVEAAGKGMLERFHQVVAAEKSKDLDVAAGRKYVSAYVEFMHYVEGLHDAVHRAGGHHPETSAGAAEKHEH